MSVFDKLKKPRAEVPGLGKSVEQAHTLSPDSPSAREMPAKPPSRAVVESNGTFVGPDRIDGWERATLRRPTPVEPYEPERERRTGKFVEGSSGNPRGRPMGLAAYIRLLTNDGQEMADHAVRALRGSIVVRKWDWRLESYVEREEPADERIQAEARTWLAEHGKLAVQDAEARDAAVAVQNVDLSKLSDEQLAQLEGLVTLALPAGEPKGET